MKTIYNTYIEVTSQEQANRLKQMCIDNNLPYWNDEDAFEFKGGYKYFAFNYDFWIRDTFYNYTKVTKTKFLKLFKDEINTKNSKSE